MKRGVMIQGSPITFDVIRQTFTNDTLANATIQALVARCLELEAEAERRPIDSPLIALLKAWPEAARLTLGNRLLHYRQGAFIVFKQKRGLERIMATSDEAEAANALAGGE